MKKVSVLLGAYLIATLLGASIGVLLWLDAGSLSQIPEYMLMAPAF